MDWLTVFSTLLEYAFIAVSIALPIVMYWFLGWLTLYAIRSKKPIQIFLSLIAIIFTTLILVGVGVNFVDYWQRTW